MNSDTQTLKSLVLFLIAGLALGCSSQADGPPPNAFKAPPLKPTSTAPKTKEEKIAAINKAGMPEAQKKAAIDAVNAGKL